MASAEVNAGGIAAMVDYVQEARGNARTSAATLGSWRFGRDKNYRKLLATRFLVFKSYSKAEVKPISKHPSDGLTSVFVSYQ